MCARFKVTTFVRERGRCNGSNDVAREADTVTEYSVRTVWHLGQAKSVEPHALNDFDVDKRKCVARAGWRRFVVNDSHCEVLWVGSVDAPGKGQSCGSSPR